MPVFLPPAAQRGRSSAMARKFWRISRPCQMSVKALSTIVPRTVRWRPSSKQSESAIVGVADSANERAAVANSVFMLIVPDVVAGLILTRGATPSIALVPLQDAPTRRPLNCFLGLVLIQSSIRLQQRRCLIVTSLENYRITQSYD